MRRREFALVCLGVAAIYVPASVFPAPDIRIFLIPWLRHIGAAGPVGAFATPFSNYTPPYLYLLSLFSLFHLPELATIKLLSIVSVCWLAWCVGRLADALDREPLPAIAMTLVLPTVVLNGPVLGQCDSFWAGCCVLAVAAAVRDKADKMAAWAGLGFAFKAQAAFLAPFCLTVVIRKRAWLALVIPPLIYLVAIVPAWLAGWPLIGLLTIYADQAAHHSLLSYAPNLWAIPSSLFLFDLPSALVFVAAALAAIAAAGYVAVVVRSDLRPSALEAALLSSLLIPFLLPNMHERYFYLADVLALTAAYVRRDRTSLAIAILVQAGSLLSIVGYVWFLFGPLMAERVLNAAGSVPMTAAVLMSLAAMLAWSALFRERGSAPRMSAHSQAGRI